MSVFRPVWRAAIAARRPSLAGYASAEDLDLVFQAAPQGPDEHALIHAADFRSERALYTLHDATGLRLALDAPFLYAAALDHACGMLSVPFERLHERDEGGGHAPCFIFSPGRTGSTLLAHLLRASGGAPVSEPDWFTQLCRLDKAVCTLIGEPMERALARAGAASVASVLGPAPFIKLRSQCNARPALLMEALPEARAVLMLRGRRAWALSRWRAFGEPPEHIADMLREGVAVFDRLAERGTPPLVIWYEDLLADPAAAIRQLMPGSAPDNAALAPVMRQDSQAGTGLSRAASKCRDLDGGFLPAFDRAWRAAHERAAGSRLSSHLLDALER